MPVSPHIGPESRELLDEPKTRLEEVLGDKCRTLGDRVQRDELRLKIGRKARVWQCHDVDRLRTLAHHHAKAIVGAGHIGPRGRELVECDAKVLRVGIAHSDIAAGDHRRYGPGARHDAVRDSSVRDRVEPLDSGDGQCR